VGKLSRSSASQYEQTRLPSGLTIVTESCPNAESVAIGIVIAGGSNDESVEQQGLAHLCEHMVFQGTERRSAQQIARDIDAAGGQVGAFTTRDYTVYHASTLGDFAFFALELMGDMLLNSTFPEEALEREKTAIVCEIEGGNDHPSQLVQDQLKKYIWADSALGRPICGSPEAVRGYSHATAKQFFQSRYRPERTIIAAAGKLEHEDFVSQVKDVFWHWRPHHQTDQNDGLKLDQRVPVYQPALLLEPAATKQAYFCLAMSAPQYTSVNRYQVHLLNKILGGGISSRLFRKLREECGLVYDIHSSYLAYEKAGMITVEGSTNPDSLSQVVPLILRDMYRMGNGAQPVSEDEIMLAKRQIVAEHSISGESIHTRMCRLATQHLYFGQPISANEVQRSIEQVSLRQLRSFARTWLAKAVENGSFALLGPPEWTANEAGDRTREWLGDLWLQDAVNPGKRGGKTPENKRKTRGSAAVA
jgi:predicted Zn-dependent peptidase